MVDHGPVSCLPQAPAQQVRRLAHCVAGVEAAVAGDDEGKETTTTGPELTGEFVDAFTGEECPVC